MNEEWSLRAEIRMGQPMYTADNRKLYPIYLHREDEKTIKKFITPGEAAILVSNLLRLFEECDYISSMREV